MRKYFHALLQYFLKIKLFDLLLILISAIIGISICNHLSLPIDWTNSYRSILCLILFKISIDFNSALRDWKESSLRIDEKLIAQTKNNIEMLMGGLIMLIVAFLSISMIPYIQIIISRGTAALPIFLIALINFSLLIVNQKRYQLKQTPMAEFVFSIHLSFSIPLIIIGFTLDRVPSFFRLVFFPIFLYFLALKVIDKVKDMSEDKIGINYLKISITTFLVIHNILIASGYFMWMIMGLFGLDAKIWTYPVLTLPIGILSIFFAGKIINGRLKDFNGAYLYSILCSLSTLFFFVVALIRN